MGFRLFGRLRKARPHVADDVEGQFGFGAPLQILYRKRPTPASADNAANEAFQTYLSPQWSPIGGGVPNKRDIGTCPPAYARQGVLAVQVGSPGILAGAFVSGPLTNVDTTQSSQPIPGGTFNNFSIPAH